MIKLDVTRPAVNKRPRVEILDATDPWRVQAIVIGNPVISASSSLTADHR
jgi:hypothetical protein